MNIQWHTLASAIITAVLWPIFGPWALLAMVGGVLIDGDHAVWFWFRTGKISLKETYMYSEYIGKNNYMKEYVLAILLLHTFDFFLIILIVSAFFNPALAFLAGFIVHMILDLIDSMKWAGRPVFIKMFSKSTVVFLFKWFFGDKKKIRNHNIDFYKNL